MSNQTAKRGLSVKDLVTIGIFTALMLVFSMVGGIFFAPNPVLTFYMPVGSAILCGPIYLLLIAKVKKRFAITIVGALIGIIWFVTGMHWAFALGTILMGIVADLVAGIGGYASRKINAISYMLYSLGGTGSYLVFLQTRTDGQRRCLETERSRAISIRCRRPETVPFSQSC